MGCGGSKSAQVDRAASRKYLHTAQLAAACTCSAVAAHPQRWPPPNQTNSKQTKFKPNTLKLFSGGSVYLLSNSGAPPARATIQPIETKPKQTQTKPTSCTGGGVYLPSSAPLTARPPPNQTNSNQSKANQTQTTRTQIICRRRRVPAQQRPPHSKRV